MLRDDTMMALASDNVHLSDFGKAHVGDLLQLTADLVDIASVSHHEAAIADFVEARLRRLPFLEVTRIEDNLVARTALGRGSRIVLGGHLDTVPPNGNDGAEIRDGRLYGCGSADMKGGIAVLLDLADRVVDAADDVTMVFYTCEEIARTHSGLLAIEAADPRLLLADAAVLLEPTNAIVEAGCQGVLRAIATFRGRRGHSARPWTGVNALHRIAPLIEAIASFDERMPTIDGCTYHETLQTVRVEGGVAANVIPDVAEVTLSYRFAPDQSVTEALTSLERLVTPYLDRDLGDDLSLVDSAPPARPFLDHPMLARVVEASGAKPVAKIAWTDVAFFAERGVPAINFGPGDPLVAHSAGEFVTASDLEKVFNALSKVLGLGGEV